MEISITWQSRPPRTPPVPPTAPPPRTTTDTRTHTHTHTYPPRVSRIIQQPPLRLLCSFLVFPSWQRRLWLLSERQMYFSSLEVHLFSAPFSLPASSRRPLSSHMSSGKQLAVLFVFFFLKMRPKKNTKLRHILRQRVLNLGCVVYINDRVLAESVVLWRSGI